MTVAVTCVGCGAGDKAGGGGGLKTLTLATPDGPGRPASDDIERFADEVRRRSGGRLRVKIAWQANVRAQGGFRPGGEQSVAELVRSGENDLGMVPARTWDTLGVRSLAAVQTPFLITSDDLMARVVRDAVAGRMLDGLDDAGVVGLALLPESLRHPVGYERPLRGPGDYARADLRIPPSKVAFDLVRALGARPLDLNGGELAAAARDGRLAGTESSFLLARTLPTGATITSNVTLFPKLNTLVVAHSTYDDLSEQQRSTLHDAARETLGYVLDTNPTDVEAAQEACRSGYGVATASDGDVAALARTAAPVIAALERDPVTGPLVARIQALKSSMPEMTVAPAGCDAAAGSAAGGAATGTAAGATPIDGVYRYSLTADEMVRRGVEAEDAFENGGLWTNTLRAGRAEFATTHGPGEDFVCEASYVVRGDTAEFTIDSPNCGGHWRLRWRLTRDGLRMSDVVSLPPFDSPRDQALDRVGWSAKPWKRIAGSGPELDDFPEGVYRANVSEADLVKRGVSREDAFNEHGLLTIDLQDGRFRTTTKSANRPIPCTGNFTVDGDRVTVTADRIEGCGSAAGREFIRAEWRVDGDMLRFVSLVGDDPVIEALFGNRDWRKVG